MVPPKIRMLTVSYTHLLQGEAGLFPKDLLDYGVHRVKDGKPRLADSRLPPCIRPVKLNELPGGLLSVLAQQPLDQPSVRRERQDVYKRQA